MIGRLKDPSRGNAEQGFLALCRAPDGTWQPITMQSASSLDAASKECIADACRSLQELDQQFQAWLEITESNLMRLLDPPVKGDRVLIYGQACQIGDDGAVLLPGPAVKHGPPWPPIDVDIDEPLYQAIQQAMELKELKRTDALGTMLCAVLNEPLDLLVAVESHRPEMLEQVARFMTQVRQRQARHGRDKYKSSNGNESP